MRKFLLRFIPFLSAITLLAGCHDGGLIDEPNSPVGNLDALHEIISTRYCFLDKQGVDWDSVYAANRPLVGSRTSAYELFTIMSSMLDCLRDGHVNLSSPFGASYYREWWTAFPADFDERVVTLDYLHGAYQQMGSYSYGLIPSTNIGYLRVSSFAGGAPGEGNLDFILNTFALSPALIIDIRDNGGGELTAAQALAERFISEPTTGAYIIHKTGPGRNDFSDPRPLTFTPPEGHRIWTLPVILLTNRSTYSAANFFAAFMRTLPNVTQVGATTGGGGGIPFSSSLPAGWTIRFSACPMLDPLGRLTEDGVDPSPGHAVSFPLSASAEGRDPILDHALDIIRQAPQ